ncbi:MAG: co-chaperone GroES [Acidobacteria bacterium]|nr:co-chaperone GroES [Acidobacteriota bacterium]
MNIKPLYDRILAKRLDAKDEVKGGIIIPDTAKEKPQEAEVVEIGEGKLMKDGSIRPLTVKKGDKILLGKYSGTEIKIDDDEYIFIKEEDVLAIIK